jgi:hypothetical protein
MNHSEIENNNVIERYLMHKLSESEENAFEEHLLGCQQCRKKLEETEGVIENIRSIETEKIFGDRQKEIHKNASVPRNYFFLKIAAGLLLMIGIGSLYLFLHNQPGITKKIVTDNDKTDTIKQESPSEKKINKPLHKENKNESTLILAENYNPDPFYENLTENVYRGGDFQIYSPVNDTLSGFPVFNWKYDNTDSLTLLVINNKRVRVFEKKIGKTYRLPIKLGPGLYYWQLQTDDETLVTRRIIIK